MDMRVTWGLGHGIRRDLGKDIGYGRAWGYKRVMGYEKDMGYGRDLEYERTMRDLRV